MHTNPDVLALLALGEQAGTAEERAHVDGCPVCLAEVAEFVRVAASGPERDDRGTSWETPRPRRSGRPSERSCTSARTLPRPPRTGDTTARGRRYRGLSGYVPPRTRLPLCRRRRRLRRCRPTTSRGRRARSWVLAAAVALVVGFGLGYAVDRFVQPAETVIEKAQLQALPAWPGSKVRLGSSATPAVTASSLRGRLPAAQPGLSPGLVD